MPNKVEQFNKEQIKKIKARFTPGDTLRIHQIISGFGTDKEKTQIFEGVLLAHKGGQQPGATITVRGEIDGIGVERIFPLHSPTIKQIEIIKKGKARRAKLYYLRQAQGKRGRLKTKMAQEVIFETEQPSKEEKDPNKEENLKEESAVQSAEKNSEAQKIQEEVSPEKKIKEPEEKKAEVAE
ncbi:50S ribosomal protein L19 [Candidatus Parcubacteria bacterium 4484_255]|nr:MAG: 50S ribosomal protein L19 [Candidatus Parcubacteria bacterium 4484_255]